jgi:hypothetical protein
MYNNNQMYGVVDSIYYCNLERSDELNKRIASRNIPSGPLQPQFDIRPLSTKYELLPIFDRRMKPTVPLKCEPTYNIGHTFNPGTAQAPWSGFAANINHESQLRNQFFALQNSAQSTYVPSANSDMYQVTVDGSPTVLQPFPSLFIQPILAPFNPNLCNMGQNLFDNCTRQQVKSL